MSADRKVRRAEAAAIRRLNAELGIVSHWHFAVRTFAVVGGIGTIVLASVVLASRGPAETTAGVVTGLGFVESDYGSRPYASVRVDDRPAKVRLDPGRICRVGDRIALVRRKAPLGYRYRVTPDGCVRPGAG